MRLTMVVVLAGGLGAARFLRGLVRVVDASEIVVIGNTADDIRLYGVHISPDLDIVTFMLAGILDEEKQFGIRGDTHTLMDALRAHGHETWFGLGDADYGVCLSRTMWLDAGVPLSECTGRITNRFGLTHTMLPMTDDPVYTVVDSDEGPMHFQEYWVKHRATPRVRGVSMHGAAGARPAPGVLDAIERADAILLAPSNPVVSIGTILSVPGIRDAVRARRNVVAGISPIVGGAVVRGMADKLLPALGVEVSARGVASMYADICDAFVIDEVDAARAHELPMRAVVAQTMMRAPEDAARLAKEALEAVRA